METILKMLLNSCTLPLAGSAIAGNHIFSGMLNAACKQIRQYGKDTPSVMIRLMEAMNTISTFAKSKKTTRAHCSAC